MLVILETQDLLIGLELLHVTRANWYIHSLYSWSLFDLKALVKHLFHVYSYLFKIICAVKMLISP